MGVTDRRVVQSHFPILASVKKMDSDVILLCKSNDYSVVTVTRSFALCFLYLFTQGLVCFSLYKLELLSYTLAEC